MRDDVMRMVVMTRGGRMELRLYGDCFLRVFVKLFGLLQLVPSGLWRSKNWRCLCGS
jgi:hypothetical protein